MHSYKNYLKIFAIFLFSFISINNVYAKSETLSIQLNTIQELHNIGFYIAKEKGFYKEEGIDLEIKPYQNGMNIVDEIVQKKSTFGIGDTSLIIDWNNKKPIVILSATLKKSPLAIVTINPNIKTIYDLKDKKITATQQERDSTLISALLHFNGFIKNNIKWEEQKYNLNDLINGKVDAMVIHIDDTNYNLKELNSTYKIFSLNNNDLTSYSDIIFTSEYEIKNHPQQIKAFHKATDKGWKWFFENTKESVEIAYNKYNINKKSFEQLLKEAKIIKELAFYDNKHFGHLTKKKLQESIKLYQMSGLLPNPLGNIDYFLDPLKIHKESARIGVLAKRGYQEAEKNWKSLEKYLNSELDEFSFEIVPLSFNELEENIKNKTIDFIITNTMSYVQLEHNYNISRMATLQNIDYNYNGLTKFGGVLFTKTDSNINKIEDIKGKKFAAVSPTSFGGWIMAKELLFDKNINENELNIHFYNTHDKVVYAVLNGEADIGTVRTDILEEMAQNNLIDLKQLKIINKQEYKNFPYIVSTKLYPEWPFAKLAHTSTRLSGQVLSKLLLISNNPHLFKDLNINSWVVPLSYAPVHTLLKKMKIAPYDNYEFNIWDLILKYIIWIVAFILLIIFLIFRYIYIWNKNQTLINFNKELENQVKKRTRQLRKANKNLKILAYTDPLTGIYNRGYFMKMANKYFLISKRNKTSLQVISLDLDYFKKVNDTYGHKAGDEVLKIFTRTISSFLRESDLFARIGGEEFVILLQNSTNEGTLSFAQKVRKTVETTATNYENKEIYITVSMGISALKDETSFQELLQKSDIALYNAKHNGRNRVEIN